MFLSEPLKGGHCTQYSTVLHTPSLQYCTVRYPMLYTVDSRRPITICVWFRFGRLPRTCPHTLISLSSNLLYTTHSLTPSHTHSLTHSLTHSNTHSLTYSLTHSNTHSLTYSLTHSPPHTLTHLLTH